jgi:alanine racemase
MTRPVRARIDLKALQHNFQLACQAAPESRLMAVIKANAYGHGAVPVAHALPAADAFALASVEEAEQIDWLERARITAPLHLWLKVDTGMHRLGIPLERADAARQRLSDLVNSCGGSLRLLSHLACADAPQHPASDTQLAAFLSLKDAGLERSLANSAALLSRPDMHFDWVRPGIMLYGASPFDAGVDRSLALRPVMTLESQLIAVYARKQGDSIGYGQSWTCPEAMPVGVAAGGYGDGYPRHAPSGMPVLVNGKVVPLIGRVSMDMLCVDLRTQPEARAGDPVQLWGSGLPVEAVAARAGTISYELLCNVSRRVPRVYIHG